MLIAVILYEAVGLITVLTDKLASLIAVAVQSGAFARLARLGVLIQVCIKKYSSCLLRKVEDKSDIIKFAFTFGALAQRHLANYREKGRK